MMRLAMTLLVAGWLADAMASRDRDIEASIAAYEAGEHDEALARLNSAEERLGERPEIHYDRGLVLLAKGELEEAQKAFERGSESDRDDVRTSSFYELGNMALDAEDWEGAIAAYIECLKVEPGHDNAKWNLEIALQRREEQEKQEQENQDQQDGDGESDENQDQEKQDEENQDQENQDQESQDEASQDQAGEEPPSEDEGEQDPPEEEPGEQDGEEQPPEPEPPSSEPEEQQAEAQPIDRTDMNKALDQLDAEDNFMLGRPRGGLRRPEKDW